MIYAYDTEFLEDGRTIDLISIGIVAADGREYYAVNSDADWDRIREHDWLCKHVVPHLPLNNGKIEKSVFGGSAIFSLNHRGSRVKPRWVIANEVRDFLLGDPGDDPGDDQLPHVELWADYAAYDHVALAQLWGRMTNLPEGMPMWTHDLRQAAEMDARDLPEQESGAHDALADARHVMHCLRHLGVARADAPTDRERTA